MTEAIIPDIPNIKAHWDHPGVDPVPYLMVPMSDRSVIRYNPEIPHPGAARALDNIRRLSEMRKGCQPDDMIPGQMTIEDLLNEEEREHGSNDRRDA